jgi:hypothetical protein
LRDINRQQLRPCVYPDLVRLGPRKDGGYVVPAGLVMNSAVLLSLGIGRDWSFERAFAAANARARIVGVDRAVGPRRFARQVVVSLFCVLANALRLDIQMVRKHVRLLRSSVDYFRFFSGPHLHVRKRVATGDSASDITVPSLLALARAEQPHAVFLKIDVEGSEYALVPDIVSCEGRIGCIVVEFHGVSGRTDAFNRSVARLLEHFHIVHIHANNYSPYDSRADFPDAVEVTLVNKALIAGEPAPSTCPYPRPDLDFPNRPGRSDHVLRFD